MEFNLNDDDVKEIVRNHVGQEPHEIFSHNLPAEDELMPTTSFRARLIIKYRGREIDPKRSLFCFIKYLPQAPKPLPEAAAAAAAAVAEPEKTSPAGSSDESELTDSSSSKSSDNSEARFKPKDYIVDQFEHEYAFYKLVYPLLQRVPIKVEFMARCYLAKKDVIALEDMRMRKFRPYPSKQLSWRELVAGVKAVARFHCSGIIADEDLAKELGRSEIGSCIDKIHPEALLESIFVGDPLQQMELHIDLAESVARELGLPTHRIRAGLLKGFLDIVNWNDERRSLKRTICHGDVSPNTVLFDEGRLTEKKCFLVDFQKVHYAPRTLDVMQFMYLSTTKDQRINQEIGALDAYYREMLLCLKDCGRPDPAWDYGDVVAEYEEVRLSGLLLAVINGPLVWLEGGHNPEYTDFDSFYKKTLLRKDNSVIVKIFKDKPDFAARMGDLVVELVDYLERNEITDTSYTEEKLSELRLSLDEDLDSGEVRDSSTTREDLMNLSAALRDLPEPRSAIYSNFGKSPSKRLSLDSKLEASSDDQLNCQEPGPGTSDDMQCCLPQLPAVNVEEELDQPQDRDSDSLNENVDMALLIAEALAINAQLNHESDPDEDLELYVQVDDQPVEGQEQVAAQDPQMIEEAAGGVDLAASNTTADSGAPSSPAYLPDLLERQVLYPPSNAESHSSRDSYYSIVITESSSLPDSDADSPSNP
ncbi:hypothetical protein TKK_0016803 [Trichogramma kaykai]|uniref:CHK kinase-like domain-containing protein n=1 Tax=Trichogramma kaykai TaxID=54128 RepID=A0ABD2W3L3_9HYME